MLTTDHIEKALKPYSGFQGVFAVDQLPTIPCRGLYIANTDPSDESGEHWVLFNVTYDGTIEFFDTFGRKPDQRWPGPWLYSNQIVQSPLSAACGYHMLWFAHLRQYQSYRKIMSLYSNNLHENDVFVKLSTKRLFDL